MDFSTIVRRNIAAMIDISSSEGRSKEYNQVMDGLPLRSIRSIEDVRGAFDENMVHGKSILREIKTIMDTNADLAKVKQYFARLESETDESDEYDSDSSVDSYESDTSVGSSTHTDPDDPTYDPTQDDDDSDDEDYTTDEDSDDEDYTTGDDSDEEGNVDDDASDDEDYTTRDENDGDEEGNVDDDDSDDEDYTTGDDSDEEGNVDDNASDDEDYTAGDENDGDDTMSSVGENEPSEIDTKYDTLHTINMLETSILSARKNDKVTRMEQLAFVNTIRSYVMGLEN
jgi:hypothetical protein